MSDDSVVYIVDDNTELRLTLIDLVRSAGHECESFGSAEDFLATFEAETPGCILLDIVMAGMSGLRLQKELSQRESPLEIIFLTAYGDIGSAVEAMKDGAFDFLEKPFSNQALLDRVRRAIKQSRKNHIELLDRRKRQERLAKLTARERDVMGLMVVGKTNKMIAQDLGISVKTVEIHRSNVMRKSGCKSLAELVGIVRGPNASPEDSLTA